MKVLTHVKRYGLSSTAELVIQPIVRKVFRKHLTPTLGEISSTMNASFNDVNGLISELLDLDDEKIKELGKEYSQILEIIKSKKDKTHFSYPENFSVGKYSGFLIYSMVRTRKPEIFLETGVANGMTSTLILSGMHLNGNGTLISFDVSDDVGQIISPDLNKRWDLRILKKPFRASFLKELNSLRSVDMFCHDSDHSFKWQYFEYNSIKNHLRKGGTMFSDDIDSSYAFIDFIKTEKIQSYALIETRKIFGIAPIGWKLD